MQQRYTIGSKVPVTVSRILPIGLSVRLPNGDTGIIRVRELSWERRERAAWMDRFKVGDPLIAVMLGAQTGDALALSLRLATDDPWIDASARYIPGQLVAGVVSGIQPYGVFVDLEPTITGLVHRSQFPDWAAKRINDLFWPGDTVWVLINAIDEKRRRISLGMKSLTSHRWPDLTGVTSDSAAAGADDAPPERTPQSLHLPLQILSAQPPALILLVEDDANQRHALGKWLISAGQRVKTLESAEEALAEIDAARSDAIQPDLVLMDVDLPGMNGIKAIQQVRVHQPGAHLFLMTDWARASEHAETLKALLAEGIGLLLKPILPEDLLDVLQQTDEPGESTADHGDAAADGDGAPAPSAQPSTVPAMTDERPVPHVSIDATLSRVRRLAKATTVVVFRVDSARGQTEIVAQSGQKKLNREALPNLQFSPVRDAAEEGQTVRIDDVEVRRDYARHLLPLLAFHSCIGLPVRTHLPQKHAIFLFFTHGFPSGVAVDAYADSGALSLGALLESRLVLERTMEMQQLALLGHLTRALVHELNHQLSPVSFSSSSLAAQLDSLERLASLEAPKAEVEQELRSAREIVDNLAQGVRNLVKTSRLFGQLTVRDHEQRVLVRRVLEKSIILLEDTADRAHVQIHLAPDNPWLVTYARETHLQQIFLNVLLNAIQQIEIIRPERGGQVRVRIAKSTRTKPEKVLVHIEDDGPGLHQRLWEQVFDLGYTTRWEDGSGLGLYITRQLAANLHGRVSVTESAILWGTRFTVELPIAF